MSSRDLANLKNGLVAAWIPSLGSTGYRLVDRVGSNHGVLTNMDAGSDWVVSGGALSLDFDGSNDYVANAAPTYKASFPFTIATWANISSAYRSAINGRTYLVQATTYGNRSSIFSIATDYSNSTDRLYYFQGNNVRLTTETFTVNTWQHIVFCFDSTTSVRFFLNGIEGTIAQPVSFWADMPAGFYLGGLDGTAINCPAQLDDIRFYNRPLSATEVSLLSKERGIGFKTNSRSSSVFAKRYSYKPPKDKTYAAITRSQSDYDSLREGLVLAICPSVSGATGYRAVDVSGRGNHGTLTNMDAATDWVASNGMALDFDGSNDRVEANALRYSALPLTIACWVKPNTVSGVQMLASHYGAEGNRAWYLALINNAVRILVSPDGTAIPYGQGGTVTTDWTHVVGVIGASAFQIYLNGNAVSTTLTGSYPTSIFNSTANVIFADRATTDTPLNGQLDDVRVYNRALTPPEIRQLASRRGIGLQSTPRHTDYLETREKTYSVIVKSQQEHSSLSEGLVGAWCPSLGATGYRLIDRSGYGNHGTLTNMTPEDWVVSQGAGALDFDGVNDYVDCGVNAGNLTEKSTFSVSAWALARQTGGANTFRGLISRAQSSPYPFSIRFNTSGSVLRLVTDDTELLGPTITANQWFHITVVLAPSSRKIYFNGNLVTESTASYSITANDNKLYIGTDYVPQSDRVWDGQIDDVRIYNRALTQAEIRQLASKRGIGLQPRPRQFTYYQFPSGSKRRRILTGMP